MNIYSKLLLSYMLFAALILLVLLLSLYTSKKVFTEFDEVANVSIPMLNAAHKVELQSMRVTLETVKIVLENVVTHLTSINNEDVTFDSSDDLERRKQFEMAVQEAMRQLDLYETFIDADEQEFTKKLSAVLAAAVETYRDRMEYSSTDFDLSTVPELLSELREIEMIQIDHFDALAKKELKETDQSYTQVGKIAASTVTMSSILLAVTIILALALGVFISRSIANPINDLREAAEAVGQGLSVQAIRITTKDEIGQLGESFNKMAEDIRHFKETQSNLVQDLETKNGEMERFTYTVSHDLKSPLVTIRGFLGLIEESARNGNMEQLESDMTHIHNAGKKMQRLLDELLELSRVGRLETPHEEVQLQELVDETILHLAGRIRENDVSIEANVNGAVFYGERRRMSEVIQNLIDNAAKYMGDQAEPHITIGTETKDGALCCYVKDNGKGINPKFQDTVFGLFEQLDKEIEGTGIGLAIVKRIIEVHGARIWIDSEGEGRGSTFYFTLPQKAVSDDAATWEI